MLNYAPAKPEVVGNDVGAGRSVWLQFASGWTVSSSGGKCVNYAAENECWREYCGSKSDLQLGLEGCSSQSPSEDTADQRPVMKQRSARL